MFRCNTSTVRESLTIPHKPGKTLRRNVPCVAALLWDFDATPTLPLRIRTPRLIVLHCPRRAGLSGFDDDDIYVAVAIMLLTPYHTYVIPDADPDAARRRLEELETAGLQDAAARLSPPRTFWGPFRPHMGHIWIAGNPPPIAPTAGPDPEADANAPTEGTTPPVATMSDGDRQTCTHTPS